MVNLMWRDVLFFFFGAVVGGFAVLMYEVSKLRELLVMLKDELIKE